MINPDRPTCRKTTKWFMSQCRIAGTRRLRRCSISRRSGLPARPSLVAVSITMASVIGGDHREAGEAALAGSRLTDFREAPEPAIYSRDRHYDLSQALSSG